MAARLTTSSSLPSTQDRTAGENLTGAKCKVAVTFSLLSHPPEQPRREKVMRRNEIICEIILKWGLAKNHPQALSMFVQAFVENFRNKSLDHWDTTIPEEIAKKFIEAIKERKEQSVESLITELEIFLKNTRLSFIFLIACQMIVHRASSIVSTFFSIGIGCQMLIGVH